MRRQRPATSSSTCSGAAAGSRAPRSTASARGSASRARRSTACWPRSSSGRPTCATSTPRSRPWPRPRAASRASRRRSPTATRAAARPASGRSRSTRSPGPTDVRREPTASRIGPQPTRKHYRCPVCRDQLGGGEQRQAPLDANDLRLALDRDDGDARAVAASTGSPSSRAASRWPTSCSTSTRRASCRRSPRSSSGSRATSGRPRSPPPCGSRSSTPSGPASRLATSPGRVAPLRIAGGHVRLPGGAHWRERNPWLAFEDGVRLVRGFVQRLESGAWGPVPARLGDDLRSLVEGSATAMIKQGTSAALGRAPARDRAPRRRGAPAADPARHRHAAAQRPVAERLAWAYHATAWVLGREAAATLPARAAVRARGPPVVGLAGRGRHPRAARRRADHEPASAPGRVPARGRRPGDPGRQRPRRRRRRLPRRRRAPARGGSRHGRRRRAGAARLGRGPGRRRGPARTSR